MIRIIGFTDCCFVHFPLCKVTTVLMVQISPSSGKITQVQDVLHSSNYQKRTGSSESCCNALKYRQANVFVHCNDGIPDLTLNLLILFSDYILFCFCSSCSKVSEVKITSLILGRMHRK